MHAAPFLAMTGKRAGGVERRDLEDVKRRVGLLWKDYFERVVGGEGEAAGGASCVFDFVGAGGRVDVAGVRNVNADGGLRVIGKAGAFYGTAKDFRQAPGLTRCLV